MADTSIHSHEMARQLLTLCLREEEDAVNELLKAINIDQANELITSLAGLACGLLMVAAEDFGESPVDLLKALLP